MSPTTQGIEAKIMTQINKPAQWLVAAKKAPKGVSPLGESVADILDRIWGIHNVPSAKSAPTHWDDNYVIEVVLDHCSLGTVDDNRLTQLVVLCHDEMIRMSITARSSNYLALMFQTGAIFLRCPTIEDHIQSIRRYIT